MTVVFIHDHKFYKFNDEIYTGGGLSEEVFNRYIEKFGDLTIIGRMYTVLQKPVGLNKLNKSINVLSIDNKKLDAAIIGADIAIIRMPSIMGVRLISKVKSSSTPYLIELVGDPLKSYWFHGSLRGKFVAPIMYILTKKVVKNSKHVLYVSQNYLQKLYPNSNHNIGCADVFLEKPSQEILQERLSKIENSNFLKKCNLGLIGSLDVNYRGHKILIDSVHNLNKNGYNFNIKFLGQGNPERWKNYIQNKKLLNKVKFDGELPAGKEVLEWMDDIDILVMPTKIETLGRAVIESMSRGLPVLGSSNTALNEQLHKDSLISIKNTSNIEEKIIELIKNKHFMKEMAIRNFDKSFDYLNEVTNKKRNKFYDEIIDIEKLK